MHYCANKVTDAEDVKTFVDLVRNSKRQSWSQYRDVLSQEAMDYFDYEASAYIVRQ